MRSVDINRNPLFFDMTARPFSQIAAFWAGLKTSFLLRYTILVVLLSACQPSGAATVSSASSPAASAIPLIAWTPTFAPTTPIPTETPFLTPTFSFTATPVWPSTPTPTPIPWVVPVPIPGEGITQHCLNAQEYLPGTIALTGTLYLRSWPYQPEDMYEVGPGYRLDLPSGVIQPFEEESEIFPVLPDVLNSSPDRRWMFYFVEDKMTQATQLWLRSVDGQEKQVEAWSDDWGDKVKWLDADRLLFESPLIEDISPRKEFVIVNVFTDEIVKQTVVFDHYYQEMLSEMMLNPDLKHLMYRYGAQYALMDLSTKRDVWEMGFGSNFSETTGWSPDGREIPLAITVRDPWQDLFIVDKNGQAEPLTYMYISYEESYYVYINNAVWSPDGQSIAFTVTFYETSHDPPVTTLMVFDRQKDEIFDFCLPVNDHIQPIWSPDSHYLVVASPKDYFAYFRSHFSARNNPRLPTQDDTILIDPVNKFAVRLAADKIPSSWMVVPTTTP